MELSITRTATGQTKTATIDAADLVDNGLVTLRCGPFDSCAGEAFRMSLRSPAGPDACIAVFLTPGGDLEARLVYGEFVLDGTRIALPHEWLVQTVDLRTLDADANGGLTYSLTQWWVDRFGVFLEGSLEVPSVATRVRLLSADAVGDLSIETGRRAGECHFSGYLACRPGEVLTLLADTPDGTLSRRVALPYEPLVPPPSPGLFPKFIGLVNQEKHSVLEVGSRKSNLYSVSNRAHFLPHVRFVGFDILAGDSADVVGDAHHLTRYFPERSFGAAYSLTVLEHLLMPWRFAAELNRVLAPGALVYHATHQSWPPHAEPNDFYRFSDEALRLLFGPEAGFEIIDLHMEHRVWLYPEERTSRPYLLAPVFPGFGNVQVLSRTVREIHSPQVGWDVDVARLGERSRAYPRVPTE